MPIDLGKIFSKPLERSDDDLFKFEVPGDQLIFRFRSRQTYQKNGKVSDLVRCEILGGRKTVNQKVINVKPGPAGFFLQTDSKRIFDREEPMAGDVLRLGLIGIRPDLRNMKEFGFEFIERVPRQDGGTLPLAIDTGDDIPDQWSK